MDDAQIAVVCLAKDAGERWIFFVHAGAWPEFCDTLTSYAAADDLSFTWDDVGTCCRIAREKFSGW